MKNFLKTFVIIFLFSFGANAAEYKTFSNIQYLKTNSPKQNSLDVYVPKKAAGDKLPIVVYVHGGGFWTGDKANVKDKPKFFTDQGYVFVSVNYRLSPDPRETYKNPDDNRIQYPTHHQDVAAAFAFIHKNAEKFGGDKNRMALVGHSAGAQIVSLISTDERFLQQQGLSLANIKALVALDTVKGYNVAEVMKQNDKKESAIYANAFGDNEQVWQEASVVNHVVQGKSIPPSLIVARSGKKSQQSAQNINKLLKQNGYTSYYFFAKGMSHEEVNKKLGANNDLTKAVAEFLQKYI